MGEQDLLKGCWNLPKKRSDNDDQHSVVTLGHVVKVKVYTFPIRIISRQ